MYLRAEHDHSKKSISISINFGKAGFFICNKTFGGKNNLLNPLRKTEKLYLKYLPTE